MNWVPPDHDSDVELREHLGVDEWRLPIEAVAVRHSLSTAALFPFPTGSDIVWSADEHVIKMTAPMWADEIAAECSALERVQGRLDVTTPRLVAQDKLEGWPYLVMSHVPGQPIGELWAVLDHGQRLKLAKDLGRLTRSLNCLADEAQAGAWPAFWASCLDGVAERHRKRGASAELAAGIDGFLADVGTLEPSRMGFLHTEILEAHVLVDGGPKDPRISGMIDFADSCVGPVEYEFAAPAEFIFRGEPGVLRAYMLGYGFEASALDAKRSRELLAWSLCHRFGSLARLVKACAPQQPASLDELSRMIFGLDEG